MRAATGGWLSVPAQVATVQGPARAVGVQMSIIWLLPEELLQQSEKKTVSLSPTYRRYIVRYF